jgi:hypothetical protein
MGNGFTREAAKLGVKHDAFPLTRADDNWRTDGIAIRASLGSECEHDAGDLATCDMSRLNLPLIAPPPDWAPALSAARDIGDTAGSG